MKAAHVIYLSVLIACTSAFVIERPDENERVENVTNCKDFNVKLKQAGKRLVAVNFYAVFCPECSKIVPYFDSLSKSMLEVDFLRVNVDELPCMKDKYEIDAVPTFMYFRKQKQVSMLKKNEEYAMRSLTEQLKSQKVIEIESSNEFDDWLTAVGNKTLVVLEFCSSWSNACKDVQRKYEKLAQDEDLVDAVFLKVDLEKVPDLSEKYEIRYQPTFLFFKRKWQPIRLVGNHPEKLRDMTKYYNNV